MQPPFLLHHVEFLFAHFGYTLIFIGLLIETTPFGWLVPGALLASLGGFYAFEGPLRLSPVLLVAFLGMLSTLIGAYIIGAKTGMRLAKFLKQENNVKTAKILLEKHGAVILTTALLANVTRFWIAYIAGSQKYKFKKFLFFASIASFAWVSLLVMIGYIAGTGRHTIERGLAQAGILSWLFVLIAGGFIYKKVKEEVKEASSEFEEKQIRSKSEKNNKIQIPNRK